MNPLRKPRYNGDKCTQEIHSGSVATEVGAFQTGIQYDAHWYRSYLRNSIVLQHPASHHVLGNVAHATVLSATSLSIKLFEIKVSQHHITAHVSANMAIIIILMLTENAVLPFSLFQSFGMWSRLCASVSHSDGPFFLCDCSGYRTVRTYIEYLSIISIFGRFSLLNRA
jgi:hypothetical protein